MSDLYIIGEGNGSGVVKIGKSSDVKARLSSIQTGYPRQLQVLHIESGSGDIEGWLHTRFADFRLHGEWFDFGAHDPVAAVRAAIEEQRSTRLLEASIRAQIQEEFYAKLEVKLKERDQTWQAKYDDLWQQFFALADSLASHAKAIALAKVALAEVETHPYELLGASAEVSKMLRDTDISLFTQLTQQAFVPKMPSRQIAPEPDN